MGQLPHGTGSNLVTDPPPSFHNHTDQILFSMIIIIIIGAVRSRARNRCAPFAFLCKNEGNAVLYCEHMLAPMISAAVSRDRALETEYLL